MPATPTTPPAAPHAPSAPPHPGPRSLPAARAAFAAAVRRDTPGTDLPRYLAVLDTLLAWSAARPERLRFRADTGPASVIRFGCPNTNGVVWTARPTRDGAPTLELAPPAGSASASGTPTAAGRARAAAATATLNAHARVVLAEGDRLRIGFGALKNAAALAAVLALLDDLVDDLCEGQPDRRRDGDAATA